VPGDTGLPFARLMCVSMEGPYARSNKLRGSTGVLSTIRNVALSRPFFAFPPPPPRNIAPGINSARGWMGLRDGLDILEKVKKASLPCRDSNPYFSVHGSNNVE